MQCLFCDIVVGEVPSKTVYKDHEMQAFYDVNPVAPIHILLIPTEHIGSLQDINATNSGLVGRILAKANELANELEVDNGYRIVINCGDEGGQTVPHLHVHLLGGRQLQWPPG